jgi:hypothetical protein
MWSRPRPPSGSCASGPRRVRRKPARRVRWLRGCRTLTQRCTPWGASVIDLAYRCIRLRDFEALCRIVGERVIPCSVRSALPRTAFSRRCRKSKGIG